jgi:hypothetical protein
LSLWGLARLIGLLRIVAKACEHGDRSLTIALSPTGPLITTGGRLIWMTDSADLHHGPSDIGTTA